MYFATCIFSVHIIYTENTRLRRKGKRRYFDLKKKKQQLYALKTGKKRHMHCFELRRGHFMQNGRSTLRGKFDNAYI